jgi:hypothetical protein
MSEGDLDRFKPGDGFPSGVFPVDAFSVDLRSVYIP